MTRKINIIQIFFLFLAASVFNAHMLIPHDHHPVDSYACNENSFPQHKPTGSHHPLFPAHCHAFNELTSEKAISSPEVKYIHVDDFLPGSEVFAELHENPLSWIPVSVCNNGPLSSAIPFLFSLRAPPSLG
jgi:hypothetical protein